MNTFHMDILELGDRAAVSALIQDCPQTPDVLATRLGAFYVYFVDSTHNARFLRRRSGGH